MEQTFEFRMGPQKVIISKKRPKIARTWEVRFEDKVVFSGKFSQAFMLYHNALHSQKFFVEKLSKEAKELDA